MNESYQNLINGIFGNAAGFGGQSQEHQDCLRFQSQQQAVMSQLVGAIGNRLAPVETPEESKQQTIRWRNKSNYDRWLASIHRDPLSDCEAR